MFQRKTDEIFKELPNILGIADDIFIVGYDSDGMNHDDMLKKVLEIWRQENIELNIDKYLTKKIANFVSMIYYLLYAITK